MGMSNEMYFRKFVAQKAIPASGHFVPAQDAPTFTDDDIKTIAEKQFAWLQKQPEAKGARFWSYEITDKADETKDKIVCRGNMVSVSWGPGIGIGSSTIPPGNLKQSDAPVLWSASGSVHTDSGYGVKLHAEDGTYMELEKNANFPQGTSEYPRGTVNYSFGHPPSHFKEQSLVRGDTEESKAAYAEGCVLKTDIEPTRYPPCMDQRKGQSCILVGQKLRVRFIN